MSGICIIRTSILWLSAVSAISRAPLAAQQKQAVDSAILGCAAYYYAVPSDQPAIATALLKSGVLTRREWASLPALAASPTPAQIAKTPGGLGRCAVLAIAGDPDVVQHEYVAGRGLEERWVYQRGDPKTTAYTFVNGRLVSAVAADQRGDR